VYFEFAINGSKRILLFLHNTNNALGSPVVVQLADLPSENIDLLVHVDEEYHILPNASSIASIGTGNLGLHQPVKFESLCPNLKAVNILQVEGLWIEDDGQILPPPTAIPIVVMRPFCR